MLINCDYHSSQPVYQAFSFYLKQKKRRNLSPLRKVLFLLERGHAHPDVIVK